jgi:hypothetical protein
MIITKSFETAISGKYQGRRFGTTLQVDTENVKDLALVRKLANADAGAPVTDVLQQAAVNCVARDIEALRECDPEASLIMAAATEELAKYSTQLANVAKFSTRKES